MKEYIKNIGERKRFFLEESLSPKDEKAFIDLQTLQEDFFPSEKYKTELYQKLSSYHSFSLPQKSSLWYIGGLGLSFTCVLGFLLHFHFFTQESSFELPPPIEEISIQRSISEPDGLSQMISEDSIGTSKKDTPMIAENIFPEHIKEDLKNIPQNISHEATIVHEEISSFSSIQVQDISEDSLPVPNFDTSLETENQVFMRMHTFSDDVSNDIFPQNTEEYKEGIEGVLDMQLQYDTTIEDSSFSRIQEFQEICTKHNGKIAENQRDCIFEEIHICEFETLFPDAQELCLYIYNETSGIRK